MKRFTIILILSVVAVALYKFGVYCLTPEWYEMGKVK